MWTTIPKMLSTIYEDRPLTLDEAPTLPLDEAPTLPLDEAPLLTCDEDNLCEMPTPVSSSHSKVVLGDLHGNALKLLHFLIKYNVILPMSDPDDYTFFVDVYFGYENDNLHCDFQEIKRLIYALEVNPFAPDLLFLGDELADRGKNDIYMLWFFHKLDIAGIKYEIIQSNHGIEFAIAHEKVLREEMKGCKYLYYPVGLRAEFACSMLHMSNSITSEDIQQADVNTLVNVHQTHQKLLSYSLTADATDITLFTHAPADYTIIKPLADLLHTPYFDATPTELACSIDNINDAYLTRLKMRQLHTIFDPAAISLITAPEPSPKLQARYPLLYLLWNRDIRPTHLARSQVHPSGYPIAYCHGHDPVPDPLERPHIRSLDSDFGKAEPLSADIPNPVFRLNHHVLSVKEVRIHTLLCHFSSLMVEGDFIDLLSVLRQSLFFTAGALEETTPCQHFKSALERRVRDFCHGDITLQDFRAHSLILTEEYRHSLLPLLQSSVLWAPVLNGLSFQLSSLLLPMVDEALVEESRKALPYLPDEQQRYLLVSECAFWDEAADDSDESNEPDYPPPPPPLSCCEVVAAPLLLRRTSAMDFISSRLEEGVPPPPAAAQLTFFSSPPPAPRVVLAPSLRRLTSTVDDLFLLKKSEFNRELPGSPLAAPRIKRN